MLGKRLCTAALTFFCSALVPCCATRARALRACALSGIGYLRLPGSANDVRDSFLRCLVLLRSFDMTYRYPGAGPDNPPGTTSAVLGWQPKSPGVGQAGHRQLGGRRGEVLALVDHQVD